MKHEVKHHLSPRMAEVHLGNSMYSGVTMLVRRDGIDVYGYYDGTVGIEGGFLSWEEIEHLRRCVNMKYKDLMPPEKPGTRDESIQD